MLVRRERNSGLNVFGETHQVNGKTDPRATAGSEPKTWCLAHNRGSTNISRVHNQEGSSHDLLKQVVQA